MRVREHPKVADWPPQPGGAEHTTVESPRAASEAVLKEVHIVMDKSVPLVCTFKGNDFTYDILVTDVIFAKRLAAEFSKHVGSSLEQLGNVDVNF